jgi:ketosteroid isomerase-like protein
MLCALLNLLDIDVMQAQPDTAPDWRREIDALEAEANRAFLERDLPRLEQIFSDDLVVNSPINRVNDKRTVLDLLGRGIIGHVSSVLRHELVRRDGDLVIVMGADTVRNKPDEPAIDRRFTNVWRRENDRWRLYIRQLTVIA